MKHVKTNACRFRAQMAAVAGMLAACSSASGVTPFQMNIVDAGMRPNSFGSPLVWSPALPAYQHGAGGNVPPTPNAVFSIPTLTYDSYVALDSNGPTIASSTSSSSDGYLSHAPHIVENPTSSPSSPFSAGALGGWWFNVDANGGPVSSGPLDRVFIGQITLRPGSSMPDTAGLAVSIIEVGDSNQFGIIGRIRFGEEHATDNDGRWDQGYYLERVGRPVSGLNATFDGGTTWEIYVRASDVPAPGFGAVVAGAGFAAIRRRR